MLGKVWDGPDQIAGYRRWFVWICRGVENVSESDLCLMVGGQANCR